MKVTREEYEEVFEAAIIALVNQQAQTLIEINNLQVALDQHYKDSCNHQLEYHFDEETGIFTYTKCKVKKIGFV